MSNYRQGDVLIFELQRKYKTPVPEVMKRHKFELKGDNIIREGEVSGHKHEVINGKLYTKGDKMILEAKKGCMVFHPEHKPIAIAPGIYEINIQEEYDEEKHRSKVKD